MDMENAKIIRGASLKYSITNVHAVLAQSPLIVA